MPREPGPSVLVVGGGVAGIAAATALADAGLTVALLERRGALGGRASSFLDRDGNTVLDACKHVTLACCTNLHSLLQRLGVDSRVHYLPAITLLGPDRRTARIGSASLPAPLQGVASLLRLPWLGLGDKLSLVRALSRLPRASGSRIAEQGMSFSAWADRAGVTPTAMRGLLEPVIASACNAPPDEVCLDIAAVVLRSGFLATRTGGRLGLFDVALVDLYDAPCRAFLSARGGSVCTHAAVDAIDRTDTGVFAVTLRTGEHIEAQVCVLATPPADAGRLLRTSLLGPAIADLGRSRSASPIVSAHLWFDREFACPAALGLVGRQTHWLFTKPSVPSNTTMTSYVTTVTSADRDLAALPLEAIRDISLRDAREALSIPETANLVRWRVVRTHDATFVPSASFELIRPVQRTPVPGLYLAGDWTKTGWPSTMEGAARSGHIAAQMILDDCGQPRVFLAPDGTVV